MWQLGNGGVRPANSSFLISFFIIVIASLLLFTPALEAKGKKPARKPNGKPEQVLKSKIARMRHSPRVTNGQTTFSNSMCLVLAEEDGDFVEWDFDEDTSYSGLVISDRCVITSAYYYVDTSDTPPTADIPDPESLACYVPRDGCDTAYHFAQMILSNLAPLDSDTYQNDIAMWKTQKRMEIGKSICGQYPLFPAPISCDRNGPPARYSECFLVGWGQKEDSEDVPPPEIQPNRIRVTTLTLAECEAVRADTGESDDYTLNPSSEICIRTVDGNSGRCDWDINPVLYCKYWGNKNGGWGQESGGWGQESGGWGQGSGGWGQGSGGWGGSHQGWQNPNNGWGWEKPAFEPQQILAVGQYVYNYGSNCTTDNSATLVLKFGYEGYSDLFDACGMTCSDSLPKGYECLEKWHPALGPVYCTPQKIQHNNGWKADHRRNPIRH